MRLPMRYFIKHKKVRTQKPLSLVLVLKQTAPELSPLFPASKPFRRGDCRRGDILSSGGKKK